MSKRDIEKGIFLAEAGNVLMHEDIGEVSDGYHTFNELYHHRAVLFSVICNQNKNLAWKSKKHDDGTMYEGMFIVGIDTPEGSATYHYDIEPYWNYFDIEELAAAPVWDGHTPYKAIRRIQSLGQQKSKRHECALSFLNRMRDATPEELASIESNIEKISTPISVNFWDELNS